MSRLKEQYDKLRTEKTAGVKNPIMLVRLGHYYEALYEDARIVNKVLGESMKKSDDTEFVSLHAAGMKHYIKELSEAGYTPIIAQEESK